MTNLITIFGGNGFLGKAIAEKFLESKDYNLRIVSRHASESQSEAKKKFIAGNINNTNNLWRLVYGSHTVINLVGLLFETRSSKFQQTHVEAAKNLAKVAKEQNVKKFIHVSALGVDKASTSKYAQTKYAGEQEVLKYFPNATILRPSIIFGHNDNFFKQISNISKFSPFLPLIGGGKTKMQPVCAEDIAELVLKLTSSNTFAESRIIELGGPYIYTFEELLKIILKTLKRNRLLLNVPFFMAKILGKFMETLPSPLLTADQVELLKYPNIIEESTSNLLFKDFDIKPKSIEQIYSFMSNLS
jgi:uncharacterized protein YbjT (DUF2867 family)